jgi:hypothetical protein
MDMAGSQMQIVPDPRFRSHKRQELEDLLHVGRGSRFLNGGDGSCGVEEPTRIEVAT